MPRNGFKAERLCTHEWKGECRDRLKAEGLWPEALKFREEQKKLLGDDWKAWQEMAKKFPPGPNSPKIARDQPRKQRKGKNRVPFPGTEFSGFPEGESTSEQDIAWVYQNIAKADVKPADAPSAGAWGLLKACQHNIDRAWQFYTSLWAKTLSKPKGDDREPFTNKNRPLKDLIHTVRRGNAAREKMDAVAAKNSVAD